MNTSHEDVPLLHVEGASKRYGEVVALDHVSLTVGPGEIVALVGPNGAGKSTLLKVLAGLTWPSEGRAWVLGHPAGSLPAKQQLGFLPQRVFLGETMELWEVLEFFATLRLPGLRDASGVITAALEAVGLAGLETRLVRELSGGMLQRLALAQVLLGEPRVLLLDEPALNLDVEGRQRLRDILAQVRQRGGCALVSSHLLEDAMHSADRIVILESGRVVADESAHTVAGRLESRLHVTVDDVAGARGYLERLGVRVGTNSGGQLVLYCTADRALALLSELHRAGYAPREFRTGRTSLEELLTAYLGRVQPAASPQAGEVPTNGEER
ncbi:MAG: ABC transporter ATP-binding protein [Limnochordaceae bacterium]|nr:ABC transporter ATP-binding protein [Limnochordaceae bacterium]